MTNWREAVKLSIWISRFGKRGMGVWVSWNIICGMMRQSTCWSRCRYYGSVRVMLLLRLYRIFHIMVVSHQGCAMSTTPSKRKERGSVWPRCNHKLSNWFGEGSSPCLGGRGNQWGTWGVVDPVLPRCWQKRVHNYGLGKYQLPGFWMNTHPFWKGRDLWKSTQGCGTTVWKNR